MIESEAYKWACNGDENVAFMFDLDHNYLNALVAAVDIGVNYYGWDVQKVRSFFGASLYGDSAATAKMLMNAVVSDPGTFIYYSLGYFMCNDIIDALMAKGMTRKEAYQAFLEVGPSSFSVLSKHLGLGDQFK